MFRLHKQHAKAAHLILVLNDVEETRDGLEKLLTSDGYRVDPARNEDDAVSRAKRNPPTLIVMSLGPGRSDWFAVAARIRKRAELAGNVPIVLFCIETLAEGAEVNVGSSIYLIRPDNFNQLRTFLGRLLHTVPPVL